MGLYLPTTPGKGEMRTKGGCVLQELQRPHRGIAHWTLSFIRIKLIFARLLCLLVDTGMSQRDFPHRLVPLSAGTQETQGEEPQGAARMPILWRVQGLLERFT